MDFTIQNIINNYVDTHIDEIVSRLRVHMKDPATLEMVPYDPIRHRGLLMLFVYEGVHKIVDVSPESLLESILIKEQEVMDRVNAASEAVENLTQLITDQEDSRAQAESLRRAAEEARAAAELIRAASEGERVQNENTRQSQEQARQDQESSRVEAEQSRSSWYDVFKEMVENWFSSPTSGTGIKERWETFKSAADSWKSLAESKFDTFFGTNDDAGIQGLWKRFFLKSQSDFQGLTDEMNSQEQQRQDAEARRVSAESARSGNETSRQNAEGQRSDAETQRQNQELSRQNQESSRQNNESTRQTQEGTRESNESSRQSAERSRAAAENEREDAEDERVEEFSRLKTESQAATSSANNAALSASTQAGRAAQAAENANAEAQNLSGLKTDCLNATGAAQSAAQNAGEKMTEIDALVKTINGESSAAPVRMTVSVLDTISTKNKEQQRVKVQLYPTYVMQNVLYQKVSGSSVMVNPSGVIIVTGTGESVFWIIPPQNTELWQQVSVTVRGPRVRLSRSGKMRLNGGRIRIV